MLCSFDFKCKINEGLHLVKAGRKKASLKIRDEKIILRCEHSKKYAVGVFSNNRNIIQIMKEALVQILVDIKELRFQNLSPTITYGNRNILKLELEVEDNISEKVSRKMGLFLVSRMGKRWHNSQPNHENWK